MDQRQGQPGVELFSAFYQVTSAVRFPAGETVEAKVRANPRQAPVEPSLAGYRKLCTKQAVHSGFIRPAPVSHHSIRLRLPGDTGFVAIVLTVTSVVPASLGRRQGAQLRRIQDPTKQNSGATPLLDVTRNGQLCDGRSKNAAGTTSTKRRGGLWLLSLQNPQEENRRSDRYRKNDPSRSGTRVCRANQLWPGSIDRS